jgi:hypothetical protein
MNDEVMNLRRFNQTALTWQEQNDLFGHKAFTDALASGVLTMDVADKNYVNDYMYMYTDTNKGDAFKNKWTRKYIYSKELS